VTREIRIPIRSRSHKKKFETGIFSVMLVPVFGVLSAITGKKILTSQDGSDNQK